MRALAAVILLLFAAPRPAGAQLFGGFRSPHDSVAWRHVAGVSPIHLLFGSIAGDYEQAVRRDLSVGAGATYSGPNSIFRSATSGGYDIDVSGKVRYYFNETAPAGASVGVVGGFVYGRRERLDTSDPSLPAARTQFVPTLGFTADYNRFVGSARRVVLGTGYGIKRRFVRPAEEYAEFNDVQFTLRLLFGYAW